MFDFFSAGFRSIRLTWPSAFVAIAAWISIVVAIDPAGSYPSMPEGPGLTVDEIFNVEQGVLLVEQTRSLGWLNLIPGTSLEAFKPENGYLPDHPPLGRYWLGVHHHLTWWLAPPFDPEGPFVTACARTGSATAFALTVLMIGVAATNWYGRTAGFFASLALVLMPRVYGHAHLAALETITNLTCTAAVLAVAAWWNGTTPPSRRVALLTGIVLGLALLTKIQAVLIPIPVAVWAVWRWREKALVPLLIWGVTAFVVFFASWPYLWLDPVGHLLEYLGRTTNRATIHCYYFGVRYADKDVPWHYPFVMFAVTVPVLLHVCGIVGLFRLGKENRIDSKWSPRQTPWPDFRESNAIDRKRDLLLLANCFFPLFVFALPGVAVYDGERLFLTAFPLWALFMGRGIVLIHELFRCEGGFIVATIILFFVLAAGVPAPRQIQPYYLSYYSSLVGGLKGAESRGLEIDYWGVGVTRHFLMDLVENVETDSQIAVTPALHQFQASEYTRQSPILRSHRIRVIVFDSTVSLTNPVIVFRRRADLPDRGNGPLANKVIAVSTFRHSRDEEQSVWFAYATKACSSPRRKTEELRYP